jgi:hypothetical protein
MPPLIRKETERGSMLKMIGDAILFIFSMIMFGTKPLTRLHSLCEVIFHNELFRSFVTQTVLKNISKKYARTHIFLPWKVLRSIDLDGAELTKDLCHLSFGVKVTDAHAINPRDGTPLAYTQEGVFGKIFNVQSRNFCFIMKTLLGKDSKTAYQHFLIFSGSLND